MAYDSGFVIKLSGGYKDEVEHACCFHLLLLLPHPAVIRFPLTSRFTLCVFFGADTGRFCLHRQSQTRKTYTYTYIYIYTSSKPQRAAMEASLTHKDLRSPSVPAHRDAERNFKYYNWKFVKPGQLGTPHYVSDCKHPFSIFPADLKTAGVVTLDKRNLYREAQQWPRPPTYSRSIPDNWPKDAKHYVEKRATADEIAHDRDGGRFMYEDEMADIDAYEGEADCPVCELESLVYETTIIDEVERRKREGMESLLDGAVEKYQRKLRHRMEQEGWSYIDVGSPRIRSLDPDWEGASEGWETLSVPG
jgi:hypothetical protein